MMLSFADDGRSSLQERAQQWMGGVRNRQYIAGAYHLSHDESTVNVVNPATGQTLVEVPRGCEQDVDDAVLAAERAFTSSAWKDVTPAERSRMLWRLAELIEENADFIAHIESINVGKPISVVRERDVPNAIKYFQYFAGWPSRIEGRQVAVSNAPASVSVVRVPVGVCGLVVPWNFPLSMAVWKLAPALATGCTMVLKPSEFTPLTAYLLGELCKVAGIPDGVVNVVVGTGQYTGAVLASHPRVRKIAFTGSTKVGREVLEASARSNLKRVSLELGGKSPHIVCEDADLATAIPTIVAGITSNTGQNCVAGTRLLVQRSVYSEVLEGVRDGMLGVKVGDPLDTTTEMGPLVSGSHLERVHGFVQRAIVDGARLICGGERLTGPERDTGNYYSPTLLEVSSNDLEICRDEVFGPVMTIMPFDEVADAVEIANASSYGLAAGLWTDSARTISEVTSQLESGIVWVNMYGANDPAAPFGGWKESGHGREGGSEAIELYTEARTVWIA